MSDRNPEETITVSRREWLRITALAAAATTVPAKVLADCGTCTTPQPIPLDTQSQTVIGQFFSCAAPNTAIASGGTQGNEVAWGLVAAFLGLVTQHDAFAPALLPGTTPYTTYLPCLLKEMGLNETCWQNVMSFANNAGSNFGNLQRAAANLWLGMAQAYNPHYPSNPDGTVWQVRAVSLLSQSGSFTENCDGKGNRGRAS